MTCRRDPRNALDVLYDTVAKRYPGGVEAMAFRMNISSGLLYKKFQRSDIRHRLAFVEFDEALRFCAEARVPDAYDALQSLAWAHGHLLVLVPDMDTRSDAELAEGVVQLFKEGGEVAAEIQRAMVDDNITPGEGDAIDLKIEQMMRAVADLRARVKRKVKQPATVRSIERSA